MIRFADAARRLSGRMMLLGWSAQAFWDATPAELAAMAEALLPGAGEALDREQLAALIERDGDGRGD